MNSLGQRFKRARQDLGLTQEDLAVRAGLNRAMYVSEVERDVAKPNVDMFTELVRAMAGESGRDEQGLANWILYGVDTSEELDRAEENCRRITAEKDAEIVRLHQQLDHVGGQLKRIQADKPPQYAELVDAFMKMSVQRRIELVLLARLLQRMDGVIGNSVELESVLNDAKRSGVDLDARINAVVDQRLGRVAMAG